MKKYTVGFIGYGNMARVIAGKMVSADLRRTTNDESPDVSVCVYDSDPNKTVRLPEGVSAAKSSAELVGKSDIIFVAVKPQDSATALSGLDFSGKIVVSIMAGVTISALRKLTGAQKTVRVMPNLNARVGAAFSAFTAEGLSPEEKSVVSALLGTFGEACETPEGQLNAVTGISGSGPAFVFKFIDAFVRAAEKYGFGHNVALRMAVATVTGSAALVENEAAEKGDVDIPALVRSVCSKGGTTERGVSHLDENGFESVVEEAIDRAVKRAEEMSKQYEDR